MLPLRIAARYLLARKSHNAVNVISLVAMSAVAVAVAAMVCVLSVFNGFREVAAGRLSSLDAQLAVLPAEGAVIADADSLAGVISGIDGVAVATPVLEEQGLAVYGERQMAVTFVGVEPEWRKVTGIDSIIIDGSSAIGQAWLGVGPAVKLGARPGYQSILNVYFPRRVGRINPAAPLTAFRSAKIYVGAVWQAQQNELDADRIVIPLGHMRELLDYTGAEASEIAVSLTPGASEKAVRQAIARAVPLPVASRLERREASFRMIEIEKWLTFVMLAFILLIASFNIISSLSMLIIEKRESSAILSAMGMSRRRIDSIFVIQGFLITLAGGVIGIILGAALTLAQQWGGFIQLNGDHSHMSLTTYPVALDPGDLVAVFAVVAVTGLLTGLTTLFTRK